MPSFPHRISVSLDDETYARVMALVPPNEKQGSFVVRRILQEHFAQQSPAVGEARGDYGTRAEEMLDAQQRADEMKRQKKRSNGKPV